MTNYLRLERDGAVARLLIDRPNKRNAFCQDMWEALPGLVADVMADAQVRVLLVTSAVPSVFSAGADISEMASKSPDPEWRKRNQEALRAAQVALARAPKPTIALVEGDCIGAGCGVALACDLRVASPAARFGITPARLGLVYPLHDTKLLIDLVGPAQAKRILFTGSLIAAEEAHRIGLVDVLAHDARGEAEHLAATVSAASPHSVQIAKAIVRRIVGGQTDDDEETARLFYDAFDGGDFREGVAAFIEKRKPRFEDC